jgi:hypothetical protein
LKNNINMDIWRDWLKNFYLKVKDDKRFTEIPEISDKVAVIIEPRSHELFQYVLYNFMWFLQPKGWALQIFHGTDNKSFVEEITKDMGYITKTGLPYSNLTEPIYNMLLTQSGFYKSIVGKPKHILIFQTDCILFSGELERFLGYDMIGAKWKHSLTKGCNGGLSLRNRLSMIRVCENNPWVYDNEDGFFSYRYGDQLNMPSEFEKDRFSVETCFNLYSCGTHKLYAHHDTEKVSELLEKRWRDIFEK